MNLIAIILCSLLHCLQCAKTVNDRPIIGVVAEETGKYFSKYGSSYITTSYVKFLEAGGARVVPIMIRKPQAYYEDLLSKINGVLFSGVADLIKSSGYGRTGRLIFDIATKLNKNGDYFPIWGTCLGFELLNFLAVDKQWMKACNAEDLATSINFVNGYKESRLFKDIDQSLVSVMQDDRVFLNAHNRCLTPQNYSKSGLDKYFKVLATSQDARNVTFISVIEALKYPYFGVAFQPEKVPFEWVVSKSHHNIPHTLEAVKVSQHFSDFFVDEARKSPHRFPNKTMEDAALIYNYVPTFTGKADYITIQNYFLS